MQSCSVCGQQLHGEGTTSCLKGHRSMQEAGNRWAGGLARRAVCPAVTEGLSSVTHACVGVSADSGAVANGPATWSAVRAMGSWPAGGCPSGARHRAGHVGAQQKKPLAGLEGDWRRQADVPKCSCHTAIWVPRYNRVFLSPPYPLYFFLPDAAVIGPRLQLPLPERREIPTYAVVPDLCGTRARGSCERGPDAW